MSDYSLCSQPEFDRAMLAELRHRTPYFVFSERALLDNLMTFRAHLPDTEICYAMKANSEKRVLELLHRGGASFEVASKYELRLLKEIGVPANRIIFGTSVRAESEIKDFVEYGVDRFAFDSEEELLKIARQAPGCRVYVRTHVDDKSGSVFNLAEKFGTSQEEAVELLVQRRRRGWCRTA